ncbi:carbohydrate esterase family 16 protein [Mycena alexandri]|uniref:Carbohydrate esterase family 16 protein n=1 Tax=Mycena alexandri TaxID=1745969 RepID=A0AAD6SE78_9AGAR|nr:carbohydrate esterase family 16 protein [Mycena alexandri]KAJ7025622.1 carbohydrate esterase family 16 protein [Mycena alexandri]
MLLTSLICAIAASASGVLAVGVQPGQIKHLVTFGDSYTDVVATGDQGTAWPVYAAGYSKTALHPFARSGATCSNNITFRPFPPVFGDQLPLYLMEASNGTLHLPPAETIYTLWIGTNDLGVDSLITGSNNASVVDVTGCMVDWVRTLYASGARNFIMQNMIPLQLTILYSANSYPNRFWAVERNTSDWSVLMNEMVLAGNKLTELMLQAVVPTLPGAHIALFDSHSLIQDIYDHPALYLNGTAPLNVTGCWNSCIAPFGGGDLVCTVQNGTARDSYLWADELHPSEQADRIIAREIALTLEGNNSKWSTWLS